MTTASELRSQAHALRTEASQIGDQYGNCGPGAARRRDGLYAEASQLERAAAALEAAAGPAKVGVICTGCGHDIGNEGLANLTDGYTECCNEPTR